MSYDDLLIHVGEFGRYQQFVCFLCFLGGIGNGYHLLVGVVFTYTPDFRCSVPGLENDSYVMQNELHESLVNKSIPFDLETGFSKCSQYKFSNESNTWLGNQTENCQKWVYDTSFLSNSLVTTMDLVCEKDSYVSHISMMFLLGNVVGSGIGGIISDIIGRKSGYLLLTVLHISVGIGAAFIVSIEWFLVVRFLTFVAGLGAFVNIYVLVTEFVGPKYRTLISMTTMFGWCFGMAFELLVSFLSRDWVVTQLVFSVLSAGLLSFYWLLPESPRWLITKGRNKEANEIIQKMARINKAKVPHKLWRFDMNTNRVLLQSEENIHMKSQERVSWLEMIKSTTLIIRLLIIVLNWSALNMVYYGLTLSVGSLIEGNLFLNILILVIMEFLAYVVTILLLNRMKRKVFYCSCTLLGGLSCLATMGPILAETKHFWINAVLSSIGKFGATAAFAIFWVYTVELVPTIVRNSGLGLTSFFGRAAGIASPYVVSVAGLAGGKVGKALPLILFGCLSISASLITLISLPETKGKVLPENIGDLNTKHKKLNVPEIRQRHTERPV